MPPIGDHLNIICLESEALKALVKQVAQSIRDDQQPWIDESEAMALLRIASKTTLRDYREKYRIDHRYLSSKHILYRRQSVLDTIENLTKSKSNE